MANFFNFLLSFLFGSFFLSVATLVTATDVVASAGQLSSPTPSSGAAIFPASSTASVVVPPELLPSKTHVVTHHAMHGSNDPFARPQCSEIVRDIEISSVRNRNAATFAAMSTIIGILRGDHLEQIDDPDKKIHYSMEVIRQSSGAGIKGLDWHYYASLRNCAVDQYGRTIFMKIVELGLISSLKDPMAPTLSGVPPAKLRDTLNNNLLHLAVMSKNVGVVEIVISIIGSDNTLELLSQANLEGDMPIDVAEKRVFSGDIAATLKQHYTSLKAAEMMTSRAMYSKPGTGGMGTGGPSSKQQPTHVGPSASVTGIGHTPASAGLSTGNFRPSFAATPSSHHQPQIGALSGVRPHNTLIPTQSNKMDPINTGGQQPGNTGGQQPGNTGGQQLDTPISSFPSMSANLNISPPNPIGSLLPQTGDLLLPVLPVKNNGQPAVQVPPAAESFIPEVPLPSPPRVDSDSAQLDSFPASFPAEAKEIGNTSTTSSASTTTTTGGGFAVFVGICLFTLLGHGY